MPPARRLTFQKKEMTKTLSILVSLKVTRDDDGSGDVRNADVKASGIVTAIADDTVSVAERVNWDIGMLNRPEVTITDGLETRVLADGALGLDEAVTNALERAMARLPEEQRKIWGA